MSLTFAYFLSSTIEGDDLDYTSLCSTDQCYEPDDYDQQILVDFPATGSHVSVALPEGNQLNDGGEEEDEG